MLDFLSPVIASVKKTKPKGKKYDYLFVRNKANLRWVNFAFVVHKKRKILIIIYITRQF